MSHKFEPDASPKVGNHTKYSYKCVQCGFLSKNITSVTKRAYICSGAPDDGKSQAVILSLGARQTMICNIFNEVKQNDSERRVKRKTDKLNVLAHARRARHL